MTPAAALASAARAVQDNYPPVGEIAVGPDGLRIILTAGVLGMIGLLAEAATPEHPMPAGVSIRMITRDLAALDGPNWNIEPTETNWQFIPVGYWPEECETFAEAYKCAVEFAKETA